MRPAVSSTRHGGANALNLLPLQRNNGHGQTCCWLDPVANDPARTSSRRAKNQVNSKGSGHDGALGDGIDQPAARPAFRRGILIRSPFRPIKNSIDFFRTPRTVLIKTHLLIFEQQRWSDKCSIRKTFRLGSARSAFLVQPSWLSALGNIVTLHWELFLASVRPLWYSQR
jgi:hypothetical protein